MRVAANVRQRKTSHMPELTTEDSTRATSFGSPTPPVSRRRSPWTWVLLLTGFPLLVIGVFLQSVTVVSTSYGTVLLTALGFTALADICFVLAFRRGGIISKAVAVVLLLPTLFVVSDFARRAPFVFSSEASRSAGRHWICECRESFRGTQSTIPTNAIHQPNRVPATD